jgi:hypothetical protein
VLIAGARVLVACLLAGAAAAAQPPSPSRPAGDSGTRAAGPPAAPAPPAQTPTPPVQTSTARAHAIAPSRLINVVFVKLKRRAAASYEALEASIVRAFERAKVKTYWVGLQSAKDADDVLYLNLHDSQESADRVAAVYQEVLKQHPELSKLQQRLSDLVTSETSLLTTRRDDVDAVAARPDFATMRALRVTIFQVRPGREGDFIRALRTTKAKDRSWLVYEANDTSTFALLTPLRAVRSSRRDGLAIPRTLRRSRGVFIKAETQVYSVRPAMSHVPQTFVAANPQFWRPAPSGGLH